MSYFGKYRGEVTNEKDPDKRGRLLVKVPSLGDFELGWAESCMPPSFFSLPKRGDFVWVEFEEGDLTRPVWVGIMPTREYMKNLNNAYTTDAIIMKTPGKVHVEGSTLENTAYWKMR